MQDRDIEGTILGLKGIVGEALKKEGARPPERQAADAALDLLGGLLVAVNRIAGALELIAIESSRPRG